MEATGTSHVNDTTITSPERRVRIRRRRQDSHHGLMEEGSGGEWRGSMTATRANSSYESGQEEKDLRTTPSRQTGSVWRQRGWTSSTRLQHTDTPPPKRRRRWRRISPFGKMPYFLFLIASLWLLPASAVLIGFENCLSEATKNDKPQILQMVPQFVDAVFNTTDPSHNLNLTVWVNVTGTFDTSIPLPPPEDREYWDSNQTDRGGKIMDVPMPLTTNKRTTLFNRVDVLTYLAWSQTTGFCAQVRNGTCPMGPVFGKNETDPLSFPSFGLSNNFYSNNVFRSFITTMSVSYGDAVSTAIGCVSAEITPDIGMTLTNVMTFVPLAILIFVGLATAFAAIYSPWGTTNIFRWTTNYGRDEHLLRLVTPGFGDCLQYIQFIALTGGLTLNYPGFYQPVVSKMAWSTLMFNESFVRNTTGYDALQDGIYVTTGKYGLDKFRQLVGMNSVDDIYIGMLIWLLTILGVVLLLIEIGFLVQWITRRMNGWQEEDLRAKNVPFAAGNAIRLVFNYFLLPIVAISMFQFVVADASPVYTVVLAALTILAVVGFGLWLVRVVTTTRPTSMLFDDLPTVLLYGSLYNTYSDKSAYFAAVPILLSIFRGVAIGAVQPSGVAQVVVLAICEVVMILSLHALRPFHSPTSMNAYHTFFAVARLISVLLMVAFVPTLGITGGTKGWIGYAILAMHAFVLLFGFSLNALQTIVEVAASMAGAGDEGGAAYGLSRVFGMRQLSRRQGPSRQSQGSNAAILGNELENGRNSSMLDGSARLRSQSAGSAGVLLQRQNTGLDSVEQYGPVGSQGVSAGYSSYTPTTPGEASTFSFLPSAANPSTLGRSRGQPILGLNAAESDPYYRPPRARRQTIETAQSPSRKSRGSWTSADWANKRWSEQETGTPDQNENFEGPSISGRNSPLPSQRGLDGGLADSRRSKTDYAVREVDFYYGLRGPALNANIPNRRIKTGPADPTGPTASALGWIKSFWGGKTKEKGKGFEVVRSNRLPPGMEPRNGPGQVGPEGIPVAMEGARKGPIDSDSESSQGHKPIAGPSNTGGERSSLVSNESPDDLSEVDLDGARISDIPPSLPGIDVIEGGIELPSRFPSKASQKPQSTIPDFSSMPTVPSASRRPTLPRKSSRRKSESVDMSSNPDLAPYRTSHRGGQSSMDSTTRRPPISGSRTGSRTHSITSRDSSTGRPEDADVRGIGGRGPSANARFQGDLGQDKDRPPSVGYVHQRRFRTVTPVQQNADLLVGREAEVEVVADRRRSRSSSVGGGSGRRH